MATARTVSEHDEFRYTKWFNPTDKPQAVIIHPDSPQGRIRKYVVQPGQSLDIPSEYDRAIHTVICGDTACKKSGRFCTKEHGGTVIAGLAPLLVKEGSSEKLDPALDPAMVHKLQLEQDLASGALQLQKAATIQNILLAAADVANSKEKVAPKKQ